MSDRLRDALQVLAERTPQSDPDAFAARVLAAAEPPRRRWVRLAIAAAAASVAVAVVVAAPDDEDASPPPATRRTTSTQLPPTVATMAPPTTQYVTPTTTSQQAMPGWRHVEIGGDASTTGRQLVSVAVSRDGAVVVASDRAGAWVPEGRDLLRRWSFAGAGDGSMSAVVALDEGFVAVGRSGSEKDWRAMVWRSTDGRRWTAAVLDAPAPEAMVDVTRRGSRLVAVGTRRTERGFVPVAWHSDDDGGTWAPSTFEDSGLGAPFAVTAGPAGFVAVGTDAWTSFDGTQWTRVQAPIEDGKPMLDVAYGSERVVAVGLDGQVMTSGDGRRWSKAPRVVDGGLQFDVVLALSDGSWLAAGNAGLWRSLDGRSWVLASDPVAATVRGLAQRQDGTVVAVGTARSTSGRSSSSAPAVWVRE